VLLPLKPRTQQQQQESLPQQQQQQMTWHYVSLHLARLALSQQAARSLAQQQHLELEWQQLQYLAVALLLAGYSMMTCQSLTHPPQIPCSSSSSKRTC
jgi:hypothetical protein